jgi:hypothetical protein
MTPNHKNILITGDLKTPELCQYSKLKKGTFFLKEKTHSLLKTLPKPDLATPNANTVAPLPFQQ